MEASHRSKDMTRLTTANGATISSREPTEVEEKADLVIRGRIITTPDTAPISDRRKTFIRWISARKTGAGTVGVSLIMASRGEIKTRISTKQTRVGHEKKTMEEGLRRKTAIFDLD